MIRARLLVLLLLITSLVALNNAQGPMKKLWTKYASLNSLTYSRDGSAVIGYANGTAVLFRPTDGTILASLNVASATCFTLANDGSGLYLAGRDGDKVQFYNFTTRSLTLLRHDVGTLNIPSLSPDGLQLAYQTINATSGRYQLTVLTTSGALVSRTTMASDEFIYQIAYSASNQINVLTNKGIKTFASSGTLKSSKLFSVNGYFVVPPDGSKLFFSNFSTYKIDAYDAATLTLLWSKSRGFDGLIACSHDGTKLVGQMSDAIGFKALRAWSTTDGNLLAGSFRSGTQNSYGQLAPSPATNQITVVDGNQMRMEQWSFDTAFVGTHLADLTEGALSTLEQPVNIGVQDAFLTYQYTTTGGGQTGEVIRSTSTSAVLGFPALWRGVSAMSPDGTYIAYIGARRSDSAAGLHIYRQSDGAFVASYLSASATKFAWANPSRLALVRSDGSGRCVVLDFDGTSLTLMSEITPFDAVRTFAISADGTRLAKVNPTASGDSADVYDASSASLIGSIPVTKGFGLQAGFTSENVFWVLDSVTVPEAYTLRVRFFSTSTAALPLLRTASVEAGDADGNSILAGVAPDGSTVTFSYSRSTASGFTFRALKVVRTADNAPLADEGDTYCAGATSSLLVSGDGRVALWTNGVLAVGAELPIVLTGVAVAPTSVVGGNFATGTLTLSRLAPAGGTVVSLGGGIGLTLPTSVTVPEGKATASFTVGTSGVDVSTTKTILATFDGLTLSTAFTVTPPTALAIALNPGAVTGGASSTGTITLNGLAGPSGLVVSLVSNSPVVTVPATVTVGAQGSTATFTATTTDPVATTIVTVTGTSGSATGSGTLTVTSTGGLQTSFDLSGIKGGNALLLTVTIGQAAPVGGAVYALSASDPSLAPPATVTIPAGALTVSIGIPTNSVLADILAILTATKDGVSKTASSTIQAPLVKSVNPSVTYVAGATTMTATVLLDGPAPSGITLTASSNSTFATVPASVPVTAGQSSVVVTVTLKKSPLARAVTITIGGKAFKLNLRPAQ